jgi:tetratricopeptide (TPR) repeat protein
MLHRTRITLICIGLLSLINNTSSLAFANAPGRAAEDLWHNQCERGDEAQIVRNYPLAEKFFQESLITAKPFGPQSTELQTSTAKVGSIKLLQGHLEEAEPYYQQSLKMVTEMRQRGVSLSPDSLMWLDDLGDAYEVMYRKHPEREQVCFEHCIEIRNTIAPAHHSKLASACGNLAALYMRTGKYSEAEKMLKLQIECINNQYGSKATLYVPLVSLALAQEKQKKYVEAEKNIKEAIAQMNNTKVSAALVAPLQKCLARIQTEKQKQISTK